MPNRRRTNPNAFGLGSSESSCTDPNTGETRVRILVQSSAHEHDEPSSNSTPVTRRAAADWPAAPSCVLGLCSVRLGTSGGGGGGGWNCFSITSSWPKCTACGANRAARAARSSSEMPSSSRLARSSSDGGRCFSTRLAAIGGWSGGSARIWPSAPLPPASAFILRDIHSSHCATNSTPARLSRSTLRANVADELKTTSLSAVVRIIGPEMCFSPTECQYAVASP
eukprot:7389029-Prymnesium_polylepis.1